MIDPFVMDSDKNETKTRRHQALANGLTFDEKKYEYKEDWVPSKDFLDVHSTAEMVQYLKKNPKCELEARVLGMSERGKSVAKLNRDQFLEFNGRKDSKKLRESWDDFGNDGGYDSATIGKHDFTPLLGGPFNKQLYYRDYLRMISASYYAFNHDPAIKAMTSILCDFTMGRGFQLHADNPAAQVLWDAFSEVNNIHEQFDSLAQELSIYGETMLWWLPGRQARISYRPQQGEKVPTGMLPRVRLIDPSNIAEIITIPEDILQGVLYYVWLAPTQYQMYTRDNQPSNKFIYQQIPAEQIMHTKINCVSNEKRGRSDGFPALGYSKRLRDGVNYGLVAQQKAAAWCIDTTIEGDASDLETYIQYQQAQEAHNGVHTAGSEFVHTAAIKREYLANSATSKGADSPVFSWCLNMIAMSYGIPINYLGTHLNGGGSTRASAIVATEPVSKKFERRQQVYERTLRKMFDRLCRQFGVDSGCDIIFPELITQDRSSMLKDLSLAQANGWMSARRAAEIANKEFDAKDFNYQKELADIKADDDALGLTIGAPAIQPLTAPGRAKQPGAGAETNHNKGSSLTGPQKTSIKTNLRTL